MAPLWLVQMQYVVPTTLKVGQKYALDDFATGGAARAPWSRQRATADFAANVGNALSLALRAEACDNEHLMVVVLAMKKDGLVLPGTRQEGRPAHAHARSTAIKTDECCVALAVTQASRAGRTGPSVWPVQLILELITGFGGIAFQELVIGSRLDSGRGSAWAVQILN